MPLTPSSPSLSPISPTCCQRAAVLPHARGGGRQRRVATDVEVVQQPQVQVFGRGQRQPLGQPREGLHKVKQLQTTTTRNARLRSVPLTAGSGVRDADRCSNTAARRQRPIANNVRYRYCSGVVPPMRLHPRSRPRAAAPSPPPPPWPHLQPHRPPPQLELVHNHHLAPREQKPGLRQVQTWGQGVVWSGWGWE